jgi:hypothetical protein
MRKIKIVNLLRDHGSIALVILIGIFVMTSCTYYTNEFEEVVIPESVSFDADVIPIFEAKCNDSGCHSGAISPDLQRDVAYNNLIFGGYVTDTTSADNNSLYTKIDDGGSMATYATDQDRALIELWIEDGAKDN